MYSVNPTQLQKFMNMQEKILDIERDTKRSPEMKQKMIATARRQFKTFLTKKEGYSTVPMRFGSDIHSILETGNTDNIETNLVNNIFLERALEIRDKLKLPVKEQHKEKFIPYKDKVIRCSGKCDGLSEEMVVEFKTRLLRYQSNYRTFCTRKKKSLSSYKEDYEKAIQWRFYCWLFEKPKCIYSILEFDPLVPEVLNYVFDFKYSEYQETILFEKINQYLDYLFENKLEHLITKKIIL